jgi:hypothetical protein
VHPQLAAEAKQLVAEAPWLIEFLMDQDIKWFPDTKRVNHGKLPVSSNPTTSKTLWPSLQQRKKTMTENDQDYAAQLIERYKQLDQESKLLKQKKKPRARGGSSTQGCSRSSSSTKGSKSDLPSPLRSETGQISR